MATPTLITTVGGTTSNSFGTRQEADDYFDSVLHPDTPWPSNVSASVTIGSGTNGVVTTTVDVVGTGGNSYTIVVVLAAGNSLPLSAAIVGTAITVTLGTDGSGVNDPTKNTAVLVAGIITALSGVTATYSGTGSAKLSVVSIKSFTGGTYYEETKLPALIMAAQQLTAAVEWTGFPTSLTQRLPWPRTGMFQRHGLSFVGVNDIPEELKQAQFELARLLLNSDRTEENEIDSAGITYLRAGPVTLKFRDYGSLGGSVLTSAVWDLLVPLWYTTIAGQESGNRDLLRA